MKLIFNRGKEQKDETKPETVPRSLRQGDDKTVEWKNESYKRECTFYIKNGEVEEKKGSIKIVKLQPGGKEDTLCECPINLSTHFGEKFHFGEIDLSEYLVKNKET